MQKALQEGTVKDAVKAATVHHQQREESCNE